MQADILDRGPDNRKATGLGRKHVNLVGALAHIAEEALNGIGGLNVPVHGLRKRIKCQQVLFRHHPDCCVEASSKQASREARLGHLAYQN